MSDVILLLLLAAYTAMFGPQPWYFFVAAAVVIGVLSLFKWRFWHLIVWRFYR